MDRRGRLFIRLIGAVIFLVLLVAAPAAAASESFTVVYKGNYAWHQNYQGGGRSAGAFVRTDETYSWVLTEQGEVPDQGQPDVRVVKLVAQGAISQTSNNASTNEQCTMHQLPGGGKSDLEVLRAGSDRLNVGAEIPRNVGTDISVNGSNNNCNVFHGEEPFFCTPSSCAGATVCGVIPPAFHDRDFLDAFTPGLTDVRSATGSFDVGGPRAQEAAACSSGGTESTSVAITSTLEVNGGGPLPPKKPRRPHIPVLERQKVFAKGDLLTSLFRAEAACGQAAAGLAGVVWEATVPGLASVAAGITGATILTASGPICAALVDRVRDDAEIVHDPPRSDIYRVARPRSSRRPVVRLPACPGTPAGSRSYCTALHRDELAYVGAVRNAAAIDDALIITVDRLSRAAQLGKQSAIALQGRTADGLVRSLRAASATEKRLGARVAAVIRAAHVAGHLTVTQSAAGIADVTHRLARRGVRRSLLPARALTPQPVNLLSAFTL